MKTLKLRVTFMLLGTLTFGTADTVDEQIAEIQNATPQKRVQLMNELKKDLSALGEKDRAEAITKLRTKMGIGNENSELRQTEIQQTQNMTRMQNMQQHQAAGQAMQQGAVNAGTANKFMGRK